MLSANRPLFRFFTILRYPAFLRLLTPACIADFPSVARSDNIPSYVNFQSCGFESIHARSPISRNDSR